MRFIAASKAVSVAGTAVRLSSIDWPLRAITVHARSTNPGAVYFGASDVTATNGFELTAGQALSLTLGGGSDKISDFYTNSTATTILLDFVAVFDG